MRTDNVRVPKMVKWLRVWAYVVIVYNCLYLLTILMCECVFKCARDRVTQIRESSLNIKSALKKKKWKVKFFVYWLNGCTRTCMLFGRLCLSLPSTCTRIPPHVYHVNLSISFVKHVAHVRVSFPPPLLLLLLLFTLRILANYFINEALLNHRKINWDGILNVSIMVFQRIYHQFIDFIDQEHKSSKRRNGIAVDNDNNSC